MLNVCKDTIVKSSKLLVLTFLLLLLTKRALKAKQQHQENLESRRKLAELKLAQMKQVEENRQANTKAISEKAKQDLEKVRIESIQIFL